MKEVTAAVAASQGAQQQKQQQHEDSDSEDDEEFGAASTYANYQPAKCMCNNFCKFTLHSILPVYMCKALWYCDASTVECFN